MFPLIIDCKPTSAFLGHHVTEPVPKTPPGLRPRADDLIDAAEDLATPTSKPACEDLATPTSKPACQSPSRGGRPAKEAHHYDGSPGIDVADFSLKPDSSDVDPPGPSHMIATI